MQAKTFMNKTKALLTSVAALGLLLNTAANAVVLDDENRISVKLEDGTDITLFGEVGQSQKTGYYYLPPRLTVSISDEGRPEFLFMKFITQEDLASGGARGALLHFLVKWGLTVDQEEELRGIIENRHSGELKGSAPMFAQAGEDPSFYIVSATLGDDNVTDRLITSGEAPLMPGGRAVAATKMDSVAAQLLAKTFEEDSTITDVSAVFNLAYETQLRAAKGRVVIDWSKVERETQSIHANYSRKNVGRETGKRGCFIVFCTSSERNVYEYSYDEMREDFNFLRENQYITFEFEEQLSDERVTKIREAFINYFINSMSQPAPAPAPNRSGDGGEGNADLDIRKGSKYTYDVDKVRRSVQRRRQEFRMDYKLSMRWPIQIVGNLKSWYAEAKADPHAVQTVVLDDPFYTWRDIVFLVGAKDRDLYSSEIDLTNVEIRKQRSEGGAWSSGEQITADYIEKFGSQKRFTFARGDQPDSGVFEYKVQTKYADGQVYPHNPEWKPGDWSGITIVSPFSRRTIEVEGDLEDLKAADITRVTAQLRYPKIGKEAETNVQLSVGGGKPLISESIFMNDDAEGYAYRLIFNHKDKGRFATDWSKRSSDNYIYAALPKEFNPNVLDDAAEAIIAAAKEKVVAEAGKQLAKYDIPISGGGS